MARMPGLDISNLRPPRGLGREVVSRREPHGREVVSRRAPQDSTPTNELTRPRPVERAVQTAARFQFTPFWVGTISFGTGLLIWWLFDRKRSP